MLNGGSHIVILGLSEGVVIISKVIMISVLLYFKLMWRAGGHGRCILCHSEGGSQFILAV